MTSRNPIDPPLPAELCAALLYRLNDLVYTVEPGPEGELFHLVFLGERLARELGVSACRLRSEGSEWLTRIHPEDRERFGASLRNALRTGRPVTVSYRMLGADGRTRWLEDTGLPAGEHDGTPRLCGAARDVTPRKEAETALARRDAILDAVSAGARRLLRSADWEPEVPHFLELLGRATTVSRVYVFENETLEGGQLVTSQRFEWTAEGFDAQIDNPALQRASFAGLGMERWQDVLRRDDIVHGPVREMPASERALLEPQNVRSLVVVPVFVAAGWWGFMGFDDCRNERRWSAVELDVLRAAAETLAAAIHRRRTERQLEARSEELRHSQRMEPLGRLAGGIAHDFSNLLTTMVGYADLLGLRIRDRPEALLELEEIRGAAARATRLTRQLLAFSRKQVLEPRTIDLNGIIGDMSRLLDRLIGDDVELTTHLAAGPATVHADPGQLEQVIMNLAVNARDAMPRGGRVRITTDGVALRCPMERDGASVSPGQYVRMLVTDTGDGMDEDTRARIFEPFFTTKAPCKGTGLGLSTAYGIVKQSGGFIFVDSAPGEGTTFEMLLPLSAGPAGSTEP